VKKFKQAVLHCIASRCSNEDINKQRELFYSIDINNDGYITLGELHHVFSNDDFNELKAVLRAVDTDMNGAISYTGKSKFKFTEFLAATLGKDVYTKQDKLTDAF
jgi:Ca2+-binding EF-hand superfamily protein